MLEIPAEYENLDPSTPDTEAGQSEEEVPLGDKEVTEAATTEVNEDIPIPPLAGESEVPVVQTEVNTLESSV